MKREKPGERLSARSQLNARLGTNEECVQSLLGYSDTEVQVNCWRRGRIIEHGHVAQLVADRRRKTESKGKIESEKDDRRRQGATISHQGKFRPSTRSSGMSDAPAAVDEHTRPPTPLQHDVDAPRPLVCGPEEISPPYPVYLEGTVQRGFGRGSKDLNCPTGAQMMSKHDFPALRLIQIQSS